MQDYQKLYKKRYTERRSTKLLNLVRRIVYSKLTPAMQLVAIMMLVSFKSRH